MNILDDLSENVDYDYVDYPLYIRRELLSAYVGYSAQAHWHRDVEFIYVYSGEMDYAVNGEIFHLKKGEGIFVNSRQIHYGFSDRKECDFLCIVLDPEALSFSDMVRTSFIEPLMQNSEYPYQLLKKDVDWQCEILKKLADIPVRKGQKGVADVELLGIQAALLRIWQILFTHMEAASLARPYADADLSVIRRMLEYIRDEFDEDLTLAAIAGSGGVSVSKCCSLFAEYVKTSPMAFLSKHRVKVAMQLLRTTDSSVSDIAQQVGFSGASYFSESFRKLTGMSPREYRKSSR